MNKKDLAEDILKLRDMLVKASIKDANEEYTDEIEHLDRTYKCELSREDFLKINIDKALVELETIIGIYDLDVHGEEV